MSHLKWFGAASFVAVAAIAGAMSVAVAPAEAVGRYGYEQCVRDMRAVCFSEYPVGDERLQCYLDGVESCARQYPFG